MLMKPLVCNISVAERGLRYLQLLQVAAQCRLCQFEAFFLKRAQHFFL